MLKTISRISALLDPNDRPKVLLLMLMMIVTAVFRTAGVASVMPFLAVLADPELIQRHSLLSRLYAEFDFGSSSAFLYFLGVASFIVFMSGTALQAATNWTLIRFTSMQQYHLSKRLMEDYLCRPYAFFLQRNSGDLSKTVLQETTQAVNGALVPSMRLLSVVLMALSVISLLIVADPLLAIIVAVVLATVYGSIYFGARSWLSRIGLDRVAANRERFTVAAEAFAGAKEIRLLGRERDYLDRYRKPSKRFASHQANASLLESVPQYAIEAFAFGGILLVVLYLMNAGGIAHALPLIGLYGLAGKQLIPDFQKIFSTISAIRFNMPAVDSVLSDLGAREGSRALTTVGEVITPLYPTNRIAIDNLSFRYPGNNDPALRNLSLTIPANSTIGIVGSSGGGKSTLIDLILGLLDPQDGVISIDGTPLTRENMRRWQAAIGYVPQHIFLSDASVSANIALGVPPEQIDQAAVERAARLANLHDFVLADLPQAYDTQLGERGVRLSGGQRQRIGIARALYREPQVLLFDEATSALDNATEAVVMTAIHRLAGTKTILIVAHRLSTVKPCDRIIVLDRGQVVETGTWSELQQDGPVFRKLSEAF